MPFGSGDAPRWRTRRPHDVVEKGFKEWSTKLRAHQLDLSKQLRQGASCALLPAMATVLLVSHDRFRRSRGPSSQAIVEAGADGNSASRQLRSSDTLRQLKEELSLCLRLLYLIGVFAPALLLGPLCLGLGVCRSELDAPAVLDARERRAGLHQVGANGRPLGPTCFPADMCRTLERLHSNAPRHSIQWVAARRCRRPLAAACFRTLRRSRSPAAPSRR